MKKNNKINKIVTLSIIILIFVIALVIFILNYTKDSSSLSIIEKNWINNHTSEMVDVSVYNDVPLYGQDGTGIIFSYLEEFTNTYGVNFNKISYITTNDNNSYKNIAFKVLNYNEELTDDDILMYQDYYTIISKEPVDINNLSDLTEKNIGILDADITNIRYYLNDIKKINLVTSKDSEELINNLTGSVVDYIILPSNLYLDDILTNNLSIVYHINDLYKSYVLTIKDNKTLKNIMNKYYLIYQKEKQKKVYQESFINTFTKYKKITEEQKVNYNSSSYTFGYVVNMPYENMINKEFVGTFSNYLTDFANLVDIDIKTVEYKNNAELKQALSSGEVDFLFANFDPTGTNVDIIKSVSPFEEDYLVLSQVPYNMTSIRSLKDKEVLVVANTYMHTYLTNNSVKTIAYNNTDELLRNISSNSIVILDKSTYDYYKDKKFKKFNIIYQGILPYNYNFVIRDVNKNDTFAKLFAHYISSVDYKNIEYKYNTDYIINSKNELSNMIKYIVIMLAVIFIPIVLIMFYYKQKRKKVALNKEDKLKFIDVMTSLKNRNYLNYNIKKWEENVIYPQAIVIIDLNNIKYINDNYGHTEGDEVIKKAASILIINQEENTDIVRTDGNEFLVYMVGYDEKKVIEYTRKLSKEFKNLPHEFGATLGYSMILDNVKTIDDAINEATLSMRQAKEKL